MASAPYVLLRTTDLGSQQPGIIYPAWKVVSETQHRFSLITALAANNAFLRLVLEKFGFRRDASATSGIWAAYEMPFVEDLDGTAFLTTLPDFADPVDGLDPRPLPAGTTVKEALEPQWHDTALGTALRGVFLIPGESNLGLGAAGAVPDVSLELRYGLAARLVVADLEADLDPAFSLVYEEEDGEQPLRFNETPVRLDGASGGWTTPTADGRCFESRMTGCGWNAAGRNRFRSPISEPVLAG